jgi:hypothetical protein
MKKRDYGYVLCQNFSASPISRNLLSLSSELELPCVNLSNGGGFKLMVLSFEVLNSS